MVLTKKFGPRRDKVRGKWRRPHNEEPYALTPHKILFGEEIKKNEMGGAYKTYTGFWWGNVRARDHLEDVTVDGKIILNRSL
jgi:hypothetical protein